MLKIPANEIRQRTRVLGGIFPQLSVQEHSQTEGIIPRHPSERSTQQFLWPNGSQRKVFEGNRSTSALEESKLCLLSFRITWWISTNQTARWESLTSHAVRFVSSLPLQFSFVVVRLYLILKQFYNDQEVFKNASQAANACCQWETQPERYNERKCSQIPGE